MVISLIKSGEIIGTVLNNSETGLELLTDLNLRWYK